jgi:hypothetical protein
LADAGVFSPEDVAALALAFEDALIVLKLDRGDPIAVAIAKRIIKPNVASAILLGCVMLSSPSLMAPAKLKAGGT